VTSLHRARAATTVVFFLAALPTACWGTRIPAIQERLDLSPGALGLAVLGLEGGAVLGLPAGGALVARIGSRAGLRLGFALCPAGLVAAALAPGLAWLVAGLAAMAAANSVLDVAMNAQGVEIERRCGRPVLARMHAGHSFGELAGGLGGTLAAATAIGQLTHFAGVAVVMAIGGQIAVGRLVRESGTGGPAFARPSGGLALLGLVAFCAFVAAGVTYNWIAVDLSSEHGAGPALAAGAFAAYCGALACGRLVSDRLVERLGRVRFVRAGALLAALGGALIVTAPAAAMAIAGAALIGAGLAGLVPAVLGAAPARGDLPAPVAIAAVTVVGYLGSFTGPAAVGGLAALTGLSAAFGISVIAALAVAALAGVSLRTPSTVGR
jgi:MFS family permease